MLFPIKFGLVRTPAALAVLPFAQLCAAQNASSTLPEMRVTDSVAADSLSTAPSGVGRIVRLDLERAAGSAVRIDDLLIESGAAYWDANNSLGLASGLGLRGFTQSNQGAQQLQGARAYLNGHADIAWRFARDPATVSQIEVQHGHDATFLGAGSPGGAVQYLSKAPTGTAFRRVELQATIAGGARSVFDGEWHWGTLQARTVLAGQRGGRTTEGVDDNRTAALLSTRIPWASGDLKFDLEYHGNAMPFPFGTAYAGNRFWFDKPYVDGRAEARRHYRRHALYLHQKLAESVSVEAHWQDVESTRKETLLGFFDPLNARQLRGYYRLIDETNAQRDSGVKISGGGILGEWKHRWTIAWMQHAQERLFSGPQSIGAFTLDLDNPVFPENFSSFPLSPRFVSETYRERGLGAGGMVMAGRWDWRLGVRRSSLSAASTSNPGLPLAQAADTNQTTVSAAAGWHLTEMQRLWVSRSESFLPNRGQLSGGAYLPPSQGRQWEAGWQYQSAPSEAAVQLFDVLQTNLPARDPNDRDAFVLVGANRSKGVTGSIKWQFGPVDIGGALTFQRVRVQSATIPGQGNHVVGVPSRFGALTLAVRSSNGTFSARLQGAGSLAGDSRASFSAPGYGVSALSWSPNAQDGFRWGARIDNALDKRYVRALTGADNVWQGERRKLVVWLESAL